MNARPIFVVGFPRSGTTLLQSLLGGHPNIAAPPEVHFFLRIYNLRDYWGDLSDDERAAAAMHALVEAPAGMLADCGFDEGRLVRRFNAGDRSYRSLLATLLDDFAERQGKSRWSEKTPEQTPAQAWHLMPEAQVLHIHRDPRAVIASIFATWPERRPRWMVARQWAAFTQTVIAEGQARPGSFFTVRYEDLAADPETVMRSVCGFLDEDFTPEMLAPRPERRTAVPSTTARWQAEAGTGVRPAASGWDAVPLARRALASRVLRHELAPLGYPAAARSEVALGHLLAPAQVLRSWQDQRVRRKATSGLTTPEARYDAVRALIEKELRVRLETP